MKLHSNKIEVEFTPLRISGNLLITGGPAVQFYDGNSFVPNREGVPSSPIIIEHLLSIVDPDATGASFQFTTEFYENNTLITSSTPGYTFVAANRLRVEKNIPAGTSVVIKAISKLIDNRGKNSRIYEREDFTYLRTLLKSEAPYQMELSTRGANFFDAYRDPNKIVPVTALLRKSGEELTNYEEIEFKWLNSAGLDVEENELYHDSYIENGRGMNVDLTYIDHELIRCEAWMDGELVAFDTVTYIRQFNNYRANVIIPQLPLRPGVTMLTCSVELTDHLGNIDVDAAFLVKWMVVEGSTHRELATGAVAEIPVSSINLQAANLEIYPDLKRREAYAALTGLDEVGDEVLYTDDNDNVLVVETFGN